MSEKQTQLPDQLGHFGIFGGRYVPEILIPALDELAEAYNRYKNDDDFTRELNYYLREYARPPHPTLLCRAAHEPARRGQDLSQARGPLPHRRAQAQ